MNAVWTVFCKELVDALRDRRTLLVVLLSSVAMGPLVLVLLSTLLSGMEQRLEAREVWVAGIERAPSLRNFLERQTYVVREAPPDYERRLQASRMGNPVVVVGADFEAELAAGESPLLELVSSSGDQRAQSGVGRLSRLLQGYAQEQVMLRLAVRGVAASLVQPLQVEERDLANPAARAAQFTSILPFVVLMAVVYGALHAALDTTAGERERGSLEPLLMNPVSRLALVTGKWAAVASVSMLIAVLSCLSFLPGQWLLRSESLAALFQFGVGEALAFLALLLPLAGAMSAMLMALAIRCRSFKEAQANASMLMMAASVMPMLLMFNQEGEQPWHLWVPALAQSTLMNRVLKGEAMTWLEMGLPAAACGVLTLLCLVYIARQFSKTALK